jgi:polyhydroxyalkanoate synthase
MLPKLALAPSSRSTIATEGSARLLCVHGAPPASRERLPILLVPSLINRWYILDLRSGNSVVEALTRAGLQVYVLDWGTPGDEDRYLDWDTVVARIGRAARIVRKRHRTKRIGLLGYCMGGTLAAIHAALHPNGIAALVNLAGPIDFSEAGVLGELVDPQHFDADAIADAGNVHATQMQSGFAALRPTLELSKWVRVADTIHDPAAREAFGALEAWAKDNIAFPGEAYRTYIRELYQENRLVQGTHHVRGQRVDLGNIKCPVLSIVASRDTICPPAAATALGTASGSTSADVLTVPGGHVGAVVGSRAARMLYPELASWLSRHLVV